MAKLGIEDLITEIEIFVDSCKYQPLSSTKVIVPKEELLSMLDELRLKMPSEIERCRKVMLNKEAILEDAKQKADQLLTGAKSEASTLVDEHEIVELAQQKAREIIAQASIEAQNIVDAATNDANEIRIGAMHYTKDTLLDIEAFIQKSLEDQKQQMNQMVHMLEDNVKVIATNRQEIEAQIQGATEVGENKAENEPTTDEEVQSSEEN